MKIIILNILKYIGGFRLCRKLIRNKVLILAYHGFEVHDETSFRPMLFTKTSTFEARLAYLGKYCSVIPLQDVGKKNNPENSVVITIDDGWYSTLSLASPLLKSYNNPYTVYLTTENVIDNEPIFHIVLDYLLLKSIGKTLVLTIDGQQRLSRKVDQGNEGLIQEINQLKTKKNDTDLLKKVAAGLELEIDSLIKSKAFTLLSENEVREIYAEGADIQLHTHTHNTPLDNDQAFIEGIEVNKQWINNMLGITPEHHCYPSGVYNDNSIELLKSLDIKTATTCYKGLCDDKNNLLELPRFLDSEYIPQIVFEAEVSGVLHFFRKLVGKGL